MAIHTVRWRSDAPIDLAQSTARYTRWGDDPATTVVDGCCMRVVATEHGDVPYAVRQVEDGSLEISSDQPDIALEDLRHRLAEAMPRDAIVELAGSDPTIGRLYRERPGYRPPLESDTVQALVTAISAQQVNLRWATTTRRRLVERYGVRHDFLGHHVWRFPTAEQLAAADPQELRALQFTTRKAEYIVGVSEAIAAGALHGLATDPDEVVISRLVALRGIGRWSADWYLARALGRPHVIAAGDLGVRKAVSFVYLDRQDLLDEAAVREVAGAWGEATNWAVHLLLEALA